jgi:glycosyltransferase involved in cell wall biosynthesis
MTILFLYTELASYFLAGVNELVNNGHHVHIVRWPVNKEAPFKFQFPINVTVYQRNDYNTPQLLQLAKSLHPDLIITSGWVDKGYLKVSRAFKGRIPTVMTMDNQWHGTARQKIMTRLAPWLLHRTFSNAWVPGQPQKIYAQHLGFADDKIETGFYSADVPLFAPEATYRTENKHFPHRLIYVGRYIPAKGMDLLFKAWMELCDEINHDWELWCVGAGELYDQRPLHAKIKHLGFLQPDELKKQLRHAGIFVLPSRFEPWGVVVHEMAAAGFPMILSDAIGSAAQFLKPGTNGYLFKNENPESLKAALKNTIKQPDENLKQMAIASHQAGISYTPAMWAQKVETLGR